MMKAMEVAEAEEGRLLELDVRNVTRNRKTSKTWRGDCTRCSLHAPREKRKTTSATVERSGSKARKQMVSHLDPRTGADRSVAHARATHAVSQSGLTSARPKTLQSARNTLQAWEKEHGRV